MIPLTRHRTSSTGVKIWSPGILIVAIAILTPLIVMTCNNSGLSQEVSRRSHCLEDFTVQVYSVGLIPPIGGVGNSHIGRLNSSSAIMILTIFGFVTFVGTLGIVGRARRDSAKALSAAGEIAVVQKSSIHRQKDGVDDFLVLRKICTPSKP